MSTSPTPKAYSVKAYATPGAQSPLAATMLDFCGQHSITSDVEMIRMDQINEAYERMLKSDVKYRFVIDMASLK
jgi:D-arabinose 1-dehydrogenase-like Zn-dependent alcohol dehydrogenase